jgi:hypothetical protein
MASINSAQIAKAMASAMKAELSDKWPDVRIYAESEAKKLAQSVKMIESLVQKGQITAEQAALHLQIQKNASRMAMLTLEDLGLLAVEGAINAALAAVKSVVNQAIGIALL